MRVKLEVEVDVEIRPMEDYPHDIFPRDGPIDHVDVGRFIAYGFENSTEGQLAIRILYDLRLSNRNF